MYRLIIFALVMLALSGICNGQGRSHFGAYRAQDTSYSEGQLKLSSYTGSDTGVLVIAPNGNVRRGTMLGVDTLNSYIPVANIADFTTDTYWSLSGGIQSAINMISGVREVSYTNGNIVLDSVREPLSGTVYVPNEVWTLPRGLVKNVTHPTLGTHYVNSQIYIPLTNRLDSTNPRPVTTITILGQSQPDYLVNYLNPLFWEPTRKEPVLYSTLTNDGSEYPAVIRAVPDSLLFLGSYLPNNLTEWHVENLVIRVNHDATTGVQLCGLDFKNTMNQTGESFRIESDTDNYYTVQPTYNVFGIRSGVWGTGNTQTFTNAAITGGFKYAAVGYEHSIWRNVVSLCNYYAFESATSNYAAVLDNYGMFGNKFLIHAGDFKIFASATENKISGTIRVESNTLGKWYDRDADYDIVDSLDKMVGLINWYITTGSPIDTIRVKGGANLSLEYTFATTTGALRTTKFKYPGDYRLRLGGTQYAMYLNGNGSTPAANSRFSLYGDALGMDMFVKNTLGTGFVNLVSENNNSTQAYAQLGGSTEVQGNIFGRSRRDVWSLFTIGNNARGMNIGPLNADSMVLGTNSIAYAHLLPSGNWHFAPPATFNIYRQSSMISVGINTTTPNTIGGQVTTGRVALNACDSTGLTHIVAAGLGGGIYDMVDLNATANQRRSQLANIAGFTRLYGLNDAGSAINGYSFQMQNSNGATIFGGTSAGAPSAWVGMAAGTTAIAPLRFTSGTNLTTPVSGAMEYNGTSLFFSPSTTRLRAVLADNTIPTNGQLPIGNGTNYTNATLTAGAGVSITNGAGSVTVAAIETVVNTAAGTLSPAINTHYFFTGTTSTWTLPVVGANGSYIRVKNVGTGAVTINSNSGGNDIFTSSAVNTTSVPVGSFIELKSNGTYWGVE